MKRAGITHAVLLSSFCVTENGGPKPSSEAAEILNVVHGKAELRLLKVALLTLQYILRISRVISRY